jgi:L-fucose mutarotase/ribose pyranase (RbsD/FucU family)
METRGCTNCYGIFKIVMIVDDIGIRHIVWRRIVFADANFPAASVAACTPAGLINCDGSDLPSLLKATLSLLPLDETEAPCMLMGMMPEHIAAGWKTPIWDTYKQARAPWRN